MSDLAHPRSSDLYSMVCCRILHPMGRALSEARFKVVSGQGLTFSQPNQYIAPFLFTAKFDEHGVIIVFRESSGLVRSTTIVTVSLLLPDGVETLVYTDSTVVDGPHWAYIEDVLTPWVTGKNREADTIEETARHKAAQESDKKLQHAINEWTLAHKVPTRKLEVRKSLDLESDWRDLRKLCVAFSRANTPLN